MKGVLYASLHNLLPDKSQLINKSFPTGTRYLRSSMLPQKQHRAAFATFVKKTRQQSFVNDRSRPFPMAGTNGSMTGITNFIKEHMGSFVLSFSAVLEQSGSSLLLNVYLTARYNFTIHAFVGFYTLRDFTHLISVI